MTLTSALIALVIAGVESLAVLASAMQWKGPFWQTMINAPFEILGYLIIGAPDVITPRHHYATSTRHSHSHSHSHSRVGHAQFTTLHYALPHRRCKVD